jgi:hypothetical protein
MLAALLLLAFVLPLAAQQSQQPPSLGDAARRLREQKKEAAPAKRVWTDDDLAKLPAHARVNVMGPPAEEPAPAAKPEPAAAPESPAAPPAATAPAPSAPETSGSDQEQKERERAAAEAELQDWKDRLTSAKKDLELLKREHDLARQQFYSSPQYQLDTAGQRHLDDLTSRADAKREEIEHIQLKIAELEDKLKELNQELGPKKQSLGPEQERDLWAGRQRALAEQFAQVEAQLNGMRKEAAAREMSLYPANQTGSPTSNLLQQLALRRLALLGELDELAEQARHAGVPAAWVR